MFASVANSHNKAVDMTSESFDVTRTKIIAKAWNDDQFRAQLIDDPRAVLTSMGIESPPEVKIVVHEDTADTVNFVIPSAPSEAELSESDLDSIAAGAGANRAPVW